MVTVHGDGNQNADTGIPGYCAGASIQGQEAAGSIDDPLTGEKGFQFLIFSQRLARVRNGPASSPAMLFGSDSISTLPLRKRRISSLPGLNSTTPKRGTTSGVSSALMPLLLIAH
jgi:hypothetical protein